MERFDGNHATNSATHRRRACYLTPLAGYAIDRSTCASWRGRSARAGACWRRCVHPHPPVKVLGVRSGARPWWSRSAITT